MAEKISYHDQMFHDFKCKSPKCGHLYKVILRQLLHADEVTCPKCGVKQDIREDKRTGEIGKEFDTANQLDKMGPEDRKD